MKKALRAIIGLTLVIIFAVTAVGCDVDKDMERIDNFFGYDNGGKYNAVVAELSEDNIIIYYINEGYGIWSVEGEERLIAYGIHGHGPKLLEIAIMRVTAEDIYEKEVRNNEGIFGSETVISSSEYEFSENDTCLTLKHENNETDILSENAMEALTLRKTLLPSEEIISLEATVEKMQLIPKEYSAFIEPKAGYVYKCEGTELSVDAVFLEGEWKNGGADVSVKIVFHSKVPYIEIHDRSRYGETLIFSGYMKWVDENTFEITRTEVNEMFYSAPVGLTVKKLPAEI